MTLRGHTAIAGLGITPQGKVYTHNHVGFAAEAVRLALEDAGLTRADLDGLLVNPGLSWGDMGMASFQLQQAMGLESWLLVMKRHRPDAFWLSHAVDGYSLAMDLHVTERNRGKLLEMCRRFDEMIVEAGGRFYFAKDSVVSADAVRRAWGPELIGRFLDLKRRLDPDDLLQGNQFRRVMEPNRQALSKAS